MIYPLSEPGTKKSKKEPEHDQRMQETPNKAQKGALIFELISHYGDFSQQV
jgi:hypothetical protein